MSDTREQGVAIAIAAVPKISTTPSKRTSSSSVTITTASSSPTSSKVRESSSASFKRQKLQSKSAVSTAIMMSSGPVETELPQSAFRRSGLRLSLQRSISSEPEEIKARVKTIDVNELAKRIRLHHGSLTNSTTNSNTGNSSTPISNDTNGPNNNNNNNGLPFLLLDCRGYLCYTDCHIRGAVHIACTDRFNRKRVQHSGSVLDLVSTNNRRNKTNGQNGAWRDVIVYDEGNSDLNLDDNNWSNPISFVLAHLIQENRQPIYLTGGIKEFSKYYSDLCDTSRANHKDLNMDSNICPAPLTFLRSPLLNLPTSSPVFSPTNCYSNTNSSCHNGESYVPHHTIESYENEPPTQVLPYLYVGNARDANDPELLRKLGISYVLSVTNTSPHSHYCNNSNSSTNSSTSTNGEAPEFRTKLIPVSDNLYENLAPYFEEACDFIEEARKSDTRVLIHCHAGISRSPTIAIAYIMKTINLSTLDAYAFVQRSRRIISPNLNFMGQLVEYESKLKGYASTSESSCASSTSSNSSSLSSYSSSSSDDCCIHEEDYPHLLRQTSLPEEIETQPLCSDDETTASTSQQHEPNNSNSIHPIMMMTDD